MHGHQCGSSNTDNGTADGTSYLNANNASSNTNVNIGTGTLKVVLVPLPMGKIFKL